jgi:ribonuclease Z
MDLLFLGTSSGVPIKQRNVTALALIPNGGKNWYLVDCGEGTQHQLLHTPLSVAKLQAIFITHVHGDHCYGLIGLLAGASMSGRKKPLPIIAPQAIADWINITQQLTQLYLPFELQFIAVEALPTWQDTEVTVKPVVLSHRVPSYAYQFTQAPGARRIDAQKLRQEKIPQSQIWGQLHQGQDVSYEGKILRSQDYLQPTRPGCKVVVGGDNDQPELLSQACQGAQVLVHEATYTAADSAKIGPRGHSSAAQVAAFAQAVALPHLILTHFSSRYHGNVNMPSSIAEIEQEALAHYRGQLFLAKDFARYRLHKAGQLERVA